MKQTKRGEKDARSIDETQNLGILDGINHSALSSLALFATLWYNAVLDSYKPPIELQVPFIVGAVVFVIIGLYMVKSEQKGAE